MKKPVVLVTGANGFVGESLCEYLFGNQYEVRALVRSKKSCSILAHEVYESGDIGLGINLSHAFTGVDTVIHLAGRAHKMDELESDAISLYRHANVVGTVNIARQAIECGVKRIIFLSSIKVNGEITSQDHFFSPEDLPNPRDSYGISKYEAELELWEMAKNKLIEVVIIRPPLIYGRNVKGNFKKMVQSVKLGIPLPLGLVNNQRSFVSIANLIDLIRVCIDHSNAKNELFLVSDGEDISSVELLVILGVLMNKPIRLFNVPVILLDFAARIIGKHDSYNKLCGSLQLDISKNKSLLGWSPPLSLEQGLRLVT